ncbi:hypothetical protein GN956_G24834 [Arapaima gigas]
MLLCCSHSFYPEAIEQIWLQDELPLNTTTLQGDDSQHRWILQPQHICLQCHSFCRDNSANLSAVTRYRILRHSADSTGVGTCRTTPQGLDTRPAG